MRKEKGKGKMKSGPENEAQNKCRGNEERKENYLRIK